VSDYARGNPQQNIRRSATEAAMIQDAANARAQDRLARVETALSECGERIVTLLQQFMTGSEAARITSLPINAWVNYDKHYLQGDFDYQVVGGSTEPRNESFRRQSAQQLADLSIPFVDMGVANPVALYMKLLADGFGEREVQKFITPEALQAGGAPPPPEEEMPPSPEEMGMMPPQPQEPPPAMGPEEMGMMQPEMDPALGPPPAPIDPELIAAMAAMAEGSSGPIDPSMIEVMPPL